MIPHREYFERECHSWNTFHERVSEALLNLDDRLCALEYPRVVNLELEISIGDETMTLTAVAVWSDGFTGFDATHVQPADWPTNVVFSETSGDATLTDNHDDTATVTAGSTDSTIGCAYDAFSASVDVPAAGATITGIEINQS